MLGGSGEVGRVNGKRQAGGVTHHHLLDPGGPPWAVRIMLPAPTIAYWCAIKGNSHSLLDIAVVAVGGDGHQGDGSWRNGYEGGGIPTGEWMDGQGSACPSIRCWMLAAALRVAAVRRAADRQTNECRARLSSWSLLGGGCMKMAASIVVAGG